MRAEMKSYRRVFVVVFALAIAISYLHPSFADIITLKEGGETQGQQIKGQILEETDEGVKIRMRSGITFLKKEIIASIEKKEITDALVMTKSGVEDQWGSYLPPSPFEMLMLSQFIDGCKAYYPLAENSEAKAKTESKPELRQARMMTALIYYMIASNSTDEKIKKESQSGAARCSAQLFNPSKEKIVIPFGPTMVENIRYFIDNLDNEKEKAKYGTIYFELGQDYEAKLIVKELSSEERFRNIQIAMNCYYIARDYSSGEKTKLLANKALSELQSKREEVKDPKEDLRPVNEKQ